MLIQRSAWPSAGAPSMISTFGRSGSAGRPTTAPRDRAARRKRGLGRLGIGTSRLVDHEIRSNHHATLPHRHSWTHPEGWRDWPYEAPATSRLRERCQFLRDVAEASRASATKNPAEVLFHGSHQADVSRVRGRL